MAESASGRGPATRWAARDPSGSRRWPAWPPTRTRRDTRERLRPRRPRSPAGPSHLLEFGVHVNPSRPSSPTTTCQSYVHIVADVRCQYAGGQLRGGVRSAAARPIRGGGLRPDFCRRCPRSSAPTHPWPPPISFADSTVASLPVGRPRPNAFDFSGLIADGLPDCG